MADPAGKDPQGLYDQATSLEHSKEWDRAFRMYIQAAEVFLHQGRETTSETHKRELKANAAKALGRAEKIKALRSESVRPAARNPFSREEQSRVIHQSSTLNHLHLPIWESSSTSESVHRPQGHLSHGATWTKSSLSSPGSRSWDLSPQDVTQRTITDCSVCASVINCLEHRRRFRSKLLADIVHVRTEEMIHARLFLNGTWRRISINSDLPICPDGTSMGMTSSTGSLMPALVEKAYLTAMGGYEFSGSDSCTDLLALTGWIPEHIDIQGPEFSRDRTWARLYKAFNSGDCLATFGTDIEEYLPAQAYQYGFLAMHCYAVLALEEEDDDWWVTVANPLQSSQTDEPSHHVRLTWEDACLAFRGIYFSWNPDILGRKLEFHGIWTPQALFDQEQTFTARVHLGVTIPPAAESSEIWIVLMRHVVNMQDEQGYIAAHVERNEVHPTSSDPSLQPQTFTRSPHVTVRKTLAASAEPYKISIAAIFEGFNDQSTGFTVAVFCPSQPQWQPLEPDLPFNQEVKGSFTPNSAGGNSTYPSFMLNPQYHLTVKSPASAMQQRGQSYPVRLLLHAGRDIPVNVMVLWSNGQRVFEVSQADVVMESGGYSYGSTSASGDLKAGDYTIVVSAHTPVCIGHFKLDIQSAERFELNPIPQEGAGMYCKTCVGEWSGSTAAGTPASGSYENNPMFEVKTSSSTKIMARLQHSEPTQTLPINLTLFGGTTSALGKHLATSGAYSDALPGVVIPQTMVAAGTYLLVPSVFKPGVEARFKLMVYSTTSGITVTRKQ